MTQSKNENVLSQNFFVFADPQLQAKVNPLFLQKELVKYYQLGKRNDFIRKFWENPDANDPDIKAAFKKRNDQSRMELRKFQNIIKKKQEKKQLVRKDTTRYILATLLPQVFQREAIKKSIDMNHDAAFDLKYEAMLKEKGVT